MLDWAQLFPVLQTRHLFSDRCGVFPSEGRGAVRVHSGKDERTIGGRNQPVEVSRSIEGTSRRINELTALIPGAIPDKRLDRHRYILPMMPAPGTAVRRLSNQVTPTRRSRTRTLLALCLCEMMTRRSQRIGSGRQYAAAMTPGAGPVRARDGSGLVRTAILAVMALLVVGGAACSGTSQPHGEATTSTGAAPSTTAVVSLSWSTPQHVDTALNGLADVSCPTPSFCVAVGATGPGTVGSAVVWNGTSWSSSTTQIFAQDTYNHVSCPSASFCVAGAPDGSALVWNGTSWSASPAIRWPNGADGITDVDCASSAFCMALDEDGDVRTWNGTTWSLEYPMDGGQSVSCPTVTFCVTLDTNGNARVFNGSSFASPQSIGSHGGGVTVSCPSPTSCLGLLPGAQYVVWNGASWSAPSPIGTVNSNSTPAFIDRVSCPTANFCVATLSDGHVITWDGSSWSAPQSINASLANFVGPAADVRGLNLGLVSVSCPTASFCAAVGSDGDAMVGR